MLIVRPFASMEIRLVCPVGPHSKTLFIMRCMFLPQLFIHNIYVWLSELANISLEVSFWLLVVLACV